MTLAQMLDGLVKIVGMGASIFAVITFRRNVQLRHAEWLYDLHQKFYESPTYKNIRLILDYRPSPDYSNLESSVTKGGDDKLAEALVDYLNFFEFIATLWKLGQLNRRELSMMFEYYILNLTQHTFVMTFLKDEGFENLGELIHDVAKHREKRSA